MLATTSGESRWALGMGCSLPSIRTMGGRPVLIWMSEPLALTAIVRISFSSTGYLRLSLACRWCLEQVHEFPFDLCQCFRVLGQPGAGILATLADTLLAVRVPCPALFD